MGWRAVLRGEGNAFCMLGAAAGGARCATLYQHKPDMDKERLSAAAVGLAVCYADVHA